MPRTKVKKRESSKRNRGRDERLLELETAAAQHMERVDEIHADSLNALEVAFANLRVGTPAHIQKMTLNQLRGLGLQRVNEVLTPSGLRASSVADDGYSSEQAKTFEPNKVSTDSTAPLRVSHRRRSKSASSLLVPRSGLKRMTPMANGNHASRSRMRTPMQQMRADNVGGYSARGKAQSADRLQIMTKVQPFTPMAVMRHAKIGEPVFSMTGSPVLSSNFADAIANVNIPIRNGFLSLRPEVLDSISPTYIRNIEAHTLDHLKQLQSNLDHIMKEAKKQQTNLDV